jgi:aryl-alcohol dehydrogenase-like predicted oxidoreductase
MKNPVSYKLLKLAQGLKGPIPKRTLGKTGLSVAQIGLGGESSLSNEDTYDESIQIIRTARELGINYFDTAPGYAPSEKRLGDALVGERNNIVLASKTDNRTYSGSMRLLEQSLKNLKTDHLDIWQLHHVDHKDEVEQMFGKNGALKALQEAKERGMVRYVGITGHYDPEPILEALRRFEFDTVLMVTNAADVHKHSFIKKVLPVALKQNLGIIGMKVCSRGRLFDPRHLHSMKDALDYVLTLPISTVIVGHDNVKQLYENVSIAKDHKPLLDKRIRELEEMTKSYAPLALFFRKDFEEYNPFWKPYKIKSS